MDKTYKDTYREIKQEPVISPEDETSGMETVPVDKAKKEFLDICTCGQEECICKKNRTPKYVSFIDFMKIQNSTKFEKQKSE